MHANTLTPRLLDVVDRRGKVEPTNDEEHRLAEFSKAFFGVFGFTGTAFGERVMPSTHRFWNTLLWLARMAVIVGVLWFLYPVVRSRF